MLTSPPIESNSISTIGGVNDISNSSNIYIAPSESTSNAAPTIGNNHQNQPQYKLSKSAYSKSQKSPFMQPTPQNRFQDNPIYAASNLAIANG